MNPIHPHTLIRFETYIIKGQFDLAVKLELAIFQVTDVEDIATKRLAIFYNKFGLTVGGDDAASIVFLTTSLGIKVGLVRQDTKLTTLGDLSSVGQKLVLEDNGFDFGDHVAAHYTTMHG